MLLINGASQKAKLLMDFTSEAILNFVEKERPTHIIVPDLNPIISHRPAVSNLTISVLLCLLGEGTQQIIGIDGKSKFTLHGILKEGYRCGLITATTPGMFFSKRGKWRSLGLLRRLVPIYFQYSEQTSTEINLAIEKGQKFLYRPYRAWSPPERKLCISILEGHAQQINLIAKRQLDMMVWHYHTGDGVLKTVKAVDYSFDLHIWLQTYSKCLARRHGRSVVSEQDMHELVRIIDFIRYEGPVSI